MAAYDKANSWVIHSGCLDWLANHHSHDMPISNGQWVPDLVPRGYDVFNAKERYLLVDGPRKSAKTISILNKVLRHAWNYPGARIAVVCKTTKNAKSGVWEDLVGFVVPQWEASETGFKVTKEPGMAADSKLTSFKVSGRPLKGKDGKMFQLDSEIQLHALEHTADAQKKFKGTRFSMIFISESDQWDDREIFTILSQQLRMMGPPYPGAKWPFEVHQLIIDCNPPEEADEHWLYELFWTQNLCDRPDVARDEEQMRYRRLGFKLEDNTKLDPREKSELIASCRHDKNLTDRWIHGLWVRDLSNSLFKGVFFPQRHVIGEPASPEKEEEFLVPSENCIELYTGFDLGDINNAIEFASKRENGSAEPSWDFIEEVVYIDEKIKLVDIVEAVMEVMDFWEEWMRDVYQTKKIMWRHWSDDTAFTKFRQTLGTYDHLLVAEYSKNRILLTPSSKGRDSIKARKNLMKKLLFEERLHISKKCPRLIESLTNLKPSKLKHQVMDPESPFKHAFDASTYLLGMECPHDLSERRKPTTNRMVEVPV